jgi:hypothetical protein
MIYTQLCCKDIKKNEDTQALCLVKRDKLPLRAIYKAALRVIHGTDFFIWRADLPHSTK